MTFPSARSCNLPVGTPMRSESQSAENGRRYERTLVRGLVAGDERAFEEFSDAYIPALHRFASGRLNHDRELTREIVQGTLVKAIAKISSFRGEAALLTWLCACCRAEISAHFRRNKRRPTEIEWTDGQIAEPTPLSRTPPDGPETSLLRDEAASLVHSALDLLPPRYGQVLEWKYLDDIPVQQIADRLSLKMKAAESLLTRARNAFRETYARLQIGSSHEEQ